MPFFSSDVVDRLGDLGAGRIGRQLAARPCRSSAEWRSPRRRVARLRTAASGNESGTAARRSSRCTAFRRANTRRSDRGTWANVPVNAVKNVLVFSAPLACGLLVMRSHPASNAAPASSKAPARLNAANLLHLMIIRPPRVVAAVRRAACTILVGPAKGAHCNWPAPEEHRCPSLNPAPAKSGTAELRPYTAVQRMSTTPSVCDRPALHLDDPRLLRGHGHWRHRLLRQLPEVLRTRAHRMVACRRLRAAPPARRVRAAVRRGADRVRLSAAGAPR